jgi:hypothetical protein
MAAPVEPSQIDEELVAKLMQGVGACLFQYQQIEAHLNLLLPHMKHPDATGTSTNRNVHWRELIESKFTLGPLLEDFKRKADAQDAQGFGG